jgi:hypothetical protein
MGGKHAGIEVSRDLVGTIADVLEKLRLCSATTGAVARTTLSASGDSRDGFEASVRLDTVSPFAVRDAGRRARDVL